MSQTYRFTTEQVRMALEVSAGIRAVAAEKLGCSRQAVDNYVNRTPELQQAIIEIRQSMIDLAEGQLLNAIKDGNMTAIIFFLKCHAKDRGYIDRVELSGRIHTFPSKLTLEDINRMTDAEIRAILPEGLVHAPQNGTAPG